MSGPRDKILLPARRLPGVAAFVLRGSTLQGTLRLPGARLLSGLSGGRGAACKSVALSTSRGWIGAVHRCNAVEVARCRVGCDVVGRVAERPALEVRACAGLIFAVPKRVCTSVAELRRRFAAARFRSQAFFF